MFEPDNELANAWVAKLAAEEGISGYWLGIHDKGFENKFVYDSTGKPISFHWWARNQPNNKKNNCNGDEDCVYAQNGDGKWQDLCCKKEQSYVCEKPAGKYKKNGTIWKINSTNTMNSTKIQIMSVCHCLKKYLQILF